VQDTGLRVPISNFFFALRRPCPSLDCLSVERGSRTCNANDLHILPSRIVIVVLSGLVGYVWTSERSIFVFCITRGDFSNFFHFQFASSPFGGNPRWPCDTCFCVLRAAGGWWLHAGWRTPQCRVLTRDVGVVNLSASPPASAHRYGNEWIFPAFP